MQVAIIFNSSSNKGLQDISVYYLQVRACAAAAGVSSGCARTSFCCRLCPPPSLPRRPGAPACKRLFFLLFLARSLDANERVPWNCHAAVFLIPMPAATLLSLFVVRVPCVAAIVRLRRPRSWIHRRHSWVRRHPESGVLAQAADRQIPGARRHHLLHLLWAGALRLLACRPARPSCTAPTKRQRPEACQRRIAAGTSVCVTTDGMRLAGVLHRHRAVRHRWQRPEVAGVFLCRLLRKVTRGAIQAASLAQHRGTR